MKTFAICAFLVVQQVSGVIYRLNASDYAQLPDLFALDDYYNCLLYPGDIYCYADAKLVVNESNQLFTIIQEYSDYRKTHFDHTVVHRGLCVTKTCREFLANSWDLVHTIEACLNASLYGSHGLQTNVARDKVYCTEYDEPAGYDVVDYSAALLGLALLVLNIAGTLFDYLSDKDKTIGARVLLCFSVPRNWRRLLAVSDGPEPRLNRLKCFTGLKTISTFCVIMAHSPLNAAIATSNPEYLENAYYNVMVTLVFNGTLIVQTFFVISGFLLAYNLMLLEEKRAVTWDMLPKGILIRWLRLAPVHALVLAFVCTWERHLGSGPLWKSVVGEEAVQCRRDWYYNLLYINNYIDNSDCMMHTWYLGADMQLSILGLVVFCICRGFRKLAIITIFLVGLVTPAIHTALQNLSPILLVSPEVARNIFVTDPTFNNLYKRGHTNLVNYALGLALAMWVYRLQQQKFDVTKYKKYLPLYHGLPAFCILLGLSGCVLYIDGIELPLAIRAVYSSTVKLMYGLALILLIGGAIFKFDNVYRGALEWDGWRPLGRLSYSAFLVHFIIIRTVIGAYAVLVYNSCNQLIMMFLGVLFLSYLIAVPSWLLVEAPCGELVKICFYPGEKEKGVELTRLEQETVIDGMLNKDNS